jgi:hypothetical protein
MSISNAIAKQLNTARLAFANTQNNATISEMVAIYGYTATRMAEGRQLYDAACAAVNAQAIAAGDYRAALLAAEAAEVRARASFQALAQIARAIFPANTSQRATLGLRGPMPVARSAFIAAARKLFENATSVPEVNSALAPFGYTATRLDAERAVIEMLAQAYADQAAASSESQRATRAQRDALDAMTRWVAQYLKIAKIALRQQPELIEQIGGASRNSKTPAQRAAARKAAATRAALRS